MPPCPDRAERVKKRIADLEKYKTSLEYMECAAFGKPMPDEPDPTVLSMPCREWEEKKRMWRLQVRVMLNGERTLLAPPRPS